MPNSHYYKARAKWALGQLNWQTDDMRMMLVGNAYVPDLSTHEFGSSIPSGARLANLTLAGKAVTTDGRCTATSPATFTGALAGTAIAVVIYKFITSIDLSALLVYMDQATLGLPLTIPATSDVEINFPSAGLFVL